MTTAKVSKAVKKRVALTEKCGSMFRDLSVVQEVDEC